MLGHHNTQYLLLATILSTELITEGFGPFMSSVTLHYLQKTIYLGNIVLKGRILKHIFGIFTH